MRNGLIRILLFLLAAVLAFSAAAAELTDVDAAALEEAQPVTEKDGWHFNAKGFLVGDNPGDAYMLEDEENGAWAYSDANLSIRITRYTDELRNNKKRIYCVAEVYASAESPLFAIMSPASKYRPAGYGNSEGLKNPEVLVKQNPVVLAVSDDYYGYRQFTVDQKKGAKWPTGIIIRNGEILYEKTRDSSKKRNFPPLDTLAVYQDGSMKTFISDELTAQEYIEQGAVQVFSFGPWLIRDGQPNEKAMGPDYEFDIMKYNNPRTVIGMIEPYHYILLVVGCPTDTKHLGVDGEWLIGKMQEYGCTEALNLDGGGTSCMVFNGKVIIQGKWTQKNRKLASMIAFGALDGFE